MFELAKTGELFELLTEKVFVPEDVARYAHQTFCRLRLRGTACCTRPALG